MQNRLKSQQEKQIISLSSFSHSFNSPFFFPSSHLFLPPSQSHFIPNSFIPPICLTVWSALLSVTATISSALFLWLHLFLFNPLPLSVSFYPPHPLTPVYQSLSLSLSFLFSILADVAVCFYPFTILWTALDILFIFLAISPSSQSISQSCFLPFLFLPPFLKGAQSW